MAFDLNTFAVNEPQRAIFTRGNATEWFTNQIENFSIKVDGETVEKKDAHGNTIFTQAKGKKCTVEFDVSVYDLNIIADMNGTKKKVATAASKMTSQAFEEFDIKDSQTTVVIKNEAKDGTIFVQTLTSDGSLKKAYVIADAVATGKVTYTKATRTITFNEDDIVVGDTVLVVYDYDTDSAVGFDVSGNDKPTAGKLYVEVDGYDICDQSTKLFAYYRFPNAKMQPSNQQDIKVDSVYHVTMDCAVEYCDKAKAFYNLVIPGITDGE